MARALAYVFDAYGIVSDVHVMVVALHILTVDAESVSFQRILQSRGCLLLARSGLQGVAAAAPTLPAAATATTNTWTDTCSRCTTAPQLITTLNSSSRTPWGMRLAR